MELNIKGNRRGCHGKQPKGSDSAIAKGWVLYMWKDVIGYYSTLREASEASGVSLVYLWRLSKNKVVRKSGTIKTTTRDGVYVIRQDKVNIDVVNHVKRRMERSQNPQRNLQKLKETLYSLKLF